MSKSRRKQHGSGRTPYEIAVMMADDMHPLVEALSAVLNGKDADVAIAALGVVTIDCMAQLGREERMVTLEQWCRSVIGKSMEQP